MMTSQDERTKDGRALGASLLDGAALVVVSPIVIPALLLGCRSVAKTVIKGSLFLTDAVKQLALATSEGWGDLLAEARSQVRTAPAPEGAGSRGQPVPPTHAAPGPGTTGIDHAVAEPPPHAEAVELQSITGIGSQWAALLQTAGVDTRRELARRNPAHLHEKLLQVNAQEHVVDLVPSLEQVSDWIAQAKGGAR
jgi:hypothetical protein